jgi:hypothetical protein
MSDLRVSYVPRERRSSRRSVRIVAGVLAVVAVVALVWGLTLSLVWASAWSNLGGDEVSTLRADVLSLGASGARAPEDATTVLVTLTAPMDPTVPRPPELAGAVLLVQVGAGRELPAVLILPSSMPVTVEGEGTLTLAEIQREGGLDLVVRAVMDYSEVRIDHAVAASVELLPGLVRELGPLEVCSAQGCSEPTPDEVRAWQREEDPAAVVLRGLDVVRAVAAGITPREVALSPFVARRAIRLIGEQSVTDVPLRGLTLLRLADALATPTRLDIDRLPMVIDPSTGASVVIAEAAMVRFGHLRDGTPLDAVDPTQDIDRLKASLSVAVLNGAGIDGLAGALATDLVAAGFTVAGTGNAIVFDQATTVISYLAGDADAEVLAFVLAELIVGSQVEAIALTPTFEGEDVAIVVTVGKDRASGGGATDGG